MPGFSPKQLAYNAQNANSVAIVLGDQTIAFAQTSTNRSDFGTEQLYGIGSSLPQEIQQLRISPQITVDFFALTQQGQALLGAGQDITLILANSQFNIHIMDGATNTPIRSYIQAVAGDYGENIGSNRLVLDTVTFLAMDVLDAQGNSILASNSVFSVPATVSAQFSQTGLGLG